MKRQTKLNKYLANKKVNRRHTAQLKRNAHNKSILMDLLLHENMIRQEIKLKKAMKLEENRVDLHGENLEFTDVSDEILDAEFEEVKVD